MNATGSPRPPAPPAESPAESPTASLPAGRTGAAADAPRLRSADLFGDAREVLIEHQSQLYRLRQTALGKLILTK
jgi:hemin uptake protein HemP